MLITRPFASIPIVTSVVSASVAGIATYLSASVTLAGLSINPSGSIGPSGSNEIKTGAAGANGPTGPIGPSGSGVYLLSGSRTINGGDCYQVTETLGSGQNIDWFTITGSAVNNETLGTYTTEYLCVQSGSVPAGTFDTSICTNPCNQLHFTIVDAQAIPCACIL